MDLPCVLSDLGAALTPGPLADRARRQSFPASAAANCMEACQPDRKPLREESESRKRSAGDGLRYGENRAAKSRAVATKWLPDKKGGIAVSAKPLKKWCRLEDSNP